MIERTLYESLVEDISEVEGRVFALAMHPKTAKPAIVYTVYEKDNGLGCKNYREWELHLYTTEYMQGKEIKDKIVKTVKSSVGAKKVTIEDAFFEEAELFAQIIKFNTGRSTQ